MSKLLKAIPGGYTPRDCQVDALTQLEQAWKTHDVFILNCPVASGKSLQAITIAKWMQSHGSSTAILTPQVLLQDQYTAEFTDIPALKGRARYKCKDSELYATCEDKHDATETPCLGCPYVCAKKTIKESPVGIYNLYSYIYDDQEYSDVLVIDEAHSVVSQLQEYYTTKLWQFEDAYPDNLATQGDAVVWMEKYVTKLHKERDEAQTIPRRIALSRKISKLDACIKGINRNPGHFFYENKAEDYRGRKERCILIRPVTLQHVNQSLWKQHKKIVMMSATMSMDDMEYLGMKGKKCKYIEVGSPIPKENRPIIVRPTAQMSHANLKSAVPLICAEILKLAEEHQGKGMVHITYGLVPLFKKYLTSDRFIWHTQSTRISTYEKFRKSESNPILVACGMAEGIDLVGEQYEWQVIAKIMFPSLMDELIKRQKELEPKWYAWQAVKTTIQQTGRICRTPSDKGTTYILDSSFNFLFYKNKPLFPKYIHEALIWLPRKATK